MAITNTGIVERTITGVNESDLFLDSEATSSVDNTGIVERSILGVHDANFVRPLGDNELNTGVISNAGGGSFTFTDSGLKAISDGTSGFALRPRVLWSSLTIGREYRIVGTPTINSGSTNYAFYNGASYEKNQVAVEAFDITFTCNGTAVFFTNDGRQAFDIDWDLSLKEVLVNRESTTTNTGVVERSLTGVNESELWLDAESTSSVNNTGIVERPITGVNESDPMFPNNTISNIVNLAGNLVIALINAFKSRVSTDGGTLDNEVGLNIDDLDDTASFTMIPNAYKDGTLYSVLPEDASGDFDVVRGSSATRVNSLGLIEEVSSNEPRIDYTSGSPALLIEPQATNLLAYSNDFTTYNNVISRFTITPNAIVSPDGTLNATKLEKNTSSGTAVLRASGLNTIGVQYTISVYAKKGNSDKMRIRVGGVQQSVTLTDEWARYEFTATATGTLSDVASIVGGSAGDFIYVYGAQVEEDTPATSYIPTTGVIATRLADSITGAGDANTFNSTEGVLYVEMAALIDDGTTRYISLSDGTNGNDLRVYFNVGGNISVLSKVGGSTQSFINSNAYAQTDFNKVAFKYKENDFALWINGVEAGTDVSGATTAAGTLNELAFFGNNLPFYGKVKDLRTYNTALTDAELLTLTTL